MRFTFSGGAVLERLLTHNQYTVTVTVRQQEQAEKLKAKGVHTAIASLDDLAVLEGLASEADSERMRHLMVASC